MTGQNLREARRKRGWTQRQAAERLGVSQGYVSMLEGNHRRLCGRLLESVLSEYEVSPSGLPFHGTDTRSQVSAEVLATQMAALGYPGFSYMNARTTWNPAELLVVALSKDNLEPRVAEALPWLVLKYHDMDWEWVVREAKLHDAQNRLGFAVTLARELAERNHEAATADKLQSTENRLQRSRLASVGTFCNERMSQAEKQWLRERSSPEAQQWNILSDLRPEHLAHAV